MQEWDYLDIGTGSDAIPRSALNRLLTGARTTQKRLGLGGSAGEAVISDRGSRVRAGQVVGVLTARGVSLEILPKIDGLDCGATRLNLVRMLARANGFRIADGEMDDLGHQRFDLLELLIALFCRKLFAAIHRGLPRRYVASADDLNALRGRLDVNRQFTALAASPQRLACQFEELSANIALNQILKAAVRVLRQKSRSLDNQRRLVELDYVFADIALVAATPTLFGSVMLDRTNAAWHDLFRLAQLLLGDQFQNTSIGEDRGFSLLFDMSALFERFVGRVFQEALRGTDLKVTLQGPRGFALSDTSGGTQRFMTRPDIVIHRSGRTLMMIDTKWKRLCGFIDDPKQGVAQADVYQMMAYGQIYDANQLMLLYPYHRGLAAVGLLSASRIAGRADGCLSFATVDLSDLRTVAAQLASLTAS